MLWCVVPRCGVVWARRVALCGAARLALRLRRAVARCVVLWHGVMLRVASWDALWHAAICCVTMACVVVCYVVLACVVLCCVVLCCV